MASRLPEPLRPARPEAAKPPEPAPAAHPEDDLSRQQAALHEALLRGRARRKALARALYPDCGDRSMDALRKLLGRYRDALSRARPDLELIVTRGKRGRPGWVGLRRRRPPGGMADGLPDALVRQNVPATCGTAGVDCADEEGGHGR